MPAGASMTITIALAQAMTMEDVIAAAAQIEQRLSGSMAVQDSATLMTITDELDEAA